MTILSDELHTPISVELASILFQCPNASKILVIIARDEREEAIIELTYRRLFFKNTLETMLILLERVSWSR